MSSNLSKKREMQEENVKNKKLQIKSLKINKNVEKILEIKRKYKNKKIRFSNSLDKEP